MPTTGKRHLSGSDYGQGSVPKRTPAGDRREGASHVHCRRGPYGEEFLPTALPKHCRAAVESAKVPIPLSIVQEFDETPDHRMTLGSRLWWENHGTWIFDNANVLGMTAEHLKRRDETLEDPYRWLSGWGSSNSDFICIRHLDRDMEPEKYNDDTYDPFTYDGSEDEEGTGGVSVALPGTLASLHPDEVWIATVLGLDRQQWWLHESKKRDTEELGFFAYSHHSDYGGVELLENLAITFDKAFESKDATPLSVWAELEGLALFLNTDDCIFDQSDDSDRVGRLTELLGAMALTTATFLIKKNSFRPDSEIRNLSLILSLLLMWVDGNLKTSDFFKEQNSWAAELKALADKHKIPLSGPIGVGGVVETLTEQYGIASRKRWQGIEWAAEFRKYKRKGKIGSRFFDVSAMLSTEAEVGRSSGHLGDEDHWETAMRASCLKRLQQYRRRRDSR